MGFWFLVETIPTDGNPNRGRKMFFLKKVFPQPVSEPAFEHHHWLALSSGFPNNWQKLFWGKVLGVSQRDHCVRNSSSSTHLSAEFRTVNYFNKKRQQMNPGRPEPSYIAVNSSSGWRTLKDEWQAWSSNGTTGSRLGKHFSVRSGGFFSPSANSLCILA